MVFPLESEWTVSLLKPPVPCNQSFGDCNRAHQLQLVLLSFSSSIVFFSLLWQGLRTYLSFSLSFRFNLWSTAIAKFTIQQLFFVLFFFGGWVFGLFVWPKLGDPFVYRNPREVCASYFSGRILCCV